MAWFPGLAVDPGFEVTSPSDTRYNCIAWAADDTSRWWWPVPGQPVTRAGSYWPPGIQPTGTLADFRAAFETLGYQVCADASLEEGFEKVAIYVDAAAEPTHAARQLPDGSWTSKLGRAPDITHTDLDGVGGTDGYGRVALIMRRERM
jgi:hypothetical protein